MGYIVKIAPLLILVNTLFPVFQGEVIDIATIDERVNLTCQPNASMGFKWTISKENGDFTIFQCNVTRNIVCTRVDPLPAEAFRAFWNDNVSVFSILTYDRGIRLYRCIQAGGNVLKTYSLTYVDREAITVPHCNIAPSITNGDLQVIYSCESNVSHGQLLNAVLRIEGSGQNVSTNLLPSNNIETNLEYDAFLNITKATCILSVSGPLTRSCHYPQAVNVRKTTEGNDIKVQCDVESSANVVWIVYDSDKSEIDVNNISWTRDGGRSLLIRSVSSHGIECILIVECRTYRNENKSIIDTIGYTAISALISNDNADDKPPNPSGGPGVKDDSIFFVPAMLFLTLWLITITLFGVWWGCRRGTSRALIASKTSTENHLSIEGSNTNAEDGAHDMPLANIEARSHRHVVGYNINNSALISTVETGDRPGIDTAQNESGVNPLQSNEDNNLYFTLEKSSPSPITSLRRASTSRWAHSDARPATLDQAQGSHWQGYETVGESNENVTCSYDLGEYAEVGEHFLGKGPPVQSVRPPIRKKPGREEVKEDDISRLYSKVNK